MQRSYTLLVLATFATLLLLGACSKRNAEPPAANETDVTEAVEAIRLPRTASADGASVFFITPADGDTVSSPVAVEFGVDGMSVVAAGDNQPESGHHHLLVDTELPDMGMLIPADANHIHFGDASTSTELLLEPGEHTLRLLLGDHLHIPHDPPVMSETITITVQ